ncbi:hypothetical protein [Candidatus Brachybacter algidus]|uniref:hypothetical protein n=1 Tax=Candidatus Brachybacter algidus TaxID=2982024 RepID=UPI001E179ABA|nr:hypothetical protein [Candidatus Brachybacter algidus]MBK6450319.1 hypothetical protein [Candidatus Brachybacter algidus]
MKLLLIDDLALNGWKSVLEKAIIKNIGKLDVALNFQEAITKTNGAKYDLIFLDARLTEDDHLKNEIKELTGFRILKEIRKDFDSNNFSTPIILFNASNKIWTIDLFKQYGVDSFYTKEHPNDIISKDSSSKNLKNLQADFEELLKISKDKEDILSILKIINAKTKTNIRNVNIKLRIEEKLKIGYGLLYRATTKVEKEKLLFNNEIIAFVVFWSILEEVSHDLYNRKEESDKEWILRKSEIKIQFFEDNKLKSRFQTIKEENPVYEVLEIKNAHQVNLSNQISGILRYDLGWNHHQIRLNFLDKLNKYRNDIDFIHSSTHSILNHSLKSNQKSANGFFKCKQLLEFIIKLLQ